MSFLTAEWRRLAFFNYPVDPALLRPFVPPATELDDWQGQTYVSLVGFYFQHVKLRGLPIPFHRHFEEINLRFYVRFRKQDTWVRGVVFVSEIVPKPAISWVANTIYREHYQTRPMRYRWQEVEGKLRVHYALRQKGSWHAMDLQAHSALQPIVDGSEEEFITEHYFGYTTPDQQRTYEYEVRHPRWELYPVQDWALDFDFGAVYGDRFAFLNERQPTTVFLAEGSEVSIENKRRV